MDEEQYRLLARVENLEIQVQRLVEAVREMNGWMGNPIGVMDADSEIGPLFPPETEEEDDVDLEDIEYLGFEIGYQVERGVRTALEVARAVRADLAEDWDSLCPYFADQYEKVRVVFENEPWVSEMTPEGEVQAALDALDREIA